MIYDEDVQREIERLTAIEVEKIRRYEAMRKSNDDVKGEANANQRS